MLEVRTVFVNVERADRSGREWLGAEANRVGNRHIGLLATPLRNRAGEVEGVLTLLHGSMRAEDVPPQVVTFIEKLSGVAAISIETRRLIAAQKALLEAFIQLVAAAIDAKSPYTGGHCQRVPVLTKMLAHAACDARDGPFTDFALSEDEWEAVHIASWLHDCGKVTTPEYVVDKATKLETLCDRIHEIRTRFEVLKRDAQIAYWKACAAGGDEAALASTFMPSLRHSTTTSRSLRAATKAARRWNRIASRGCAASRSVRGSVRWTIDSEFHGRNGNGRNERLPRRSPATESLLADKPEHVIERGRRTDAAGQSVRVQADDAASPLRPRRDPQPQRRSRHADRRGALQDQ